MKKTLEKMVVSLIFIILTLQMSIITFAAPNIPAATSKFYVNDFANVFTEEEVNGLMERAVDLANTYDGVQVVVSTVSSLDGYTVEEYANTMYNQYGIGKNDMGLLILISTEDRKLRIEVGRNMEAYITDAKAGRFRDNYAIPKLKENKFNEGLISLQTELINEIKNCIDNSSTTSVSNETPIEIDWSSIVFWFFVIAILILIFIICFVIHSKSNEIKNLKVENGKLRTKIHNVKEEAVDKIQQAKNGCADILEQNKLLDANYSDLNSRFNYLSDRYNRAMILYPELDSKIDAMIEEEIRQNDIQQASLVDSKIEAVIHMPADKDAVRKFEEVLYSYDSLTSSQQSYVKSDINLIRKLYQESKESKNKHIADIAIGTIIGIIGRISIGKEEHIEDLEKAQDTYEKLSHESQKYVDSSIPEKISLLLNQAIRDKEEREDAERRRREEELHSSSFNSFSDNNDSFNSFDSFSGFGGDSGGGGASGSF